MSIAGWTEIGKLLRNGVFFFLVAWCSVCHAGKNYSYEDILKLIEVKTGEEKIIALIEKSGTDFVIDENKRYEIYKKGGTPKLIEAIINYYGLKPDLPPAEVKKRYSCDDILKLVERGFDESKLIELLRKSKTDCTLDEHKKFRLYKAGASPRLMGAMEQNMFLEDVVITSPSQGDKVGRCGPVKGRSVVVNDKYLWVFIHRSDLDIWWPQTNCVKVKEDGSWILGIQYGIADDVGFEFEVVAVWLDRANHSRMETWIQDGIRTGRYPGMKLPEGSPRSNIRTIIKASH